MLFSTLPLSGLCMTCLVFRFFGRNVAKRTQCIRQMKIVFLLLLPRNPCRLRLWNMNKSACPKASKYQERSAPVPRVCVCVCVCFLPIHSGHQVRWTYQPGSHRRKVTQDLSSTFFLRCVCVGVCVFSSHSFWTSMGVPAGVTQEEGNTGFSIHLLSAVLA